MADKIKALVWEECRVGGVIAACCAVLGAIIMVSYRYQTEYTAIEQDIILYVYLICGIPLLVALLLTLNPDHRGALRGGYSARILQLPVATYLPVAVSLVSRTLFVFVVSMLSVGEAKLFYSDAPGFQLAVLLTLAYVVMQFTDWIRVLMSGLSSLLLVTLVVGIPAVIGFGDYREVLLHLQSFIVDVGRSPFLVVMFSFTTLAVAYGLSVPIVAASRKGKRFGVPEIWEWPRNLSLSRNVSMVPFRSPLAARVWLDIRHSRLIFPVVSVVLSLMFIGVVVIFAMTQDGTIGATNRLRSDWDYRTRMAMAFVPFGAIIGAALAHAARMTVRPYRTTKGLPGYTFLQPTTSADMANARMMANAVLLLPILFAAIAFHFLVPGLGFISRIIPEAWSLGVTSLREVAWLLLGRGVIIGLAAWVLMAGSTRLFLPGVLVLVSAAPLRWVLGFDRDLINTTYVAGASAFIALTVWGIVRAKRLQIVSAKSLTFWCGAWALMTWIMVGQFYASLSKPYPSLVEMLPGIGVCIGFASLVPFPFIATLLDVHRKRHSAMPNQRAAGGEETWATLFTKEKRLATALGLAAVFALWLGMPHRPAYEAVWRSHGYPANIRELAESYTGHPESEELADELETLAKRNEELYAKFNVVLMERYEERLRRKNEAPELEPQVDARFEARDHINSKLMTVGGADVARDEVVPDEVKEATTEYWEEVTRHVVMGLREVTSQISEPVRFPINLEDGMTMELRHLSEMRSFARNLVLDGYRSIWQGNPDRAIENIEHIQSLADSMANEPILISGLVRIAILGIAEGAAETTMNWAELSEPQLARLQRSFEDQFEDDESHQILLPPMIGESIFSLDFIGRDTSFGGEETALKMAQMPLLQISLSIPSERMMVGMTFSRLLETKRMTWRESKEWDADFEDLIPEWGIFAPRAAIILPALSRSFEAESRIRTQYDVAACAIAVARYRLANNRLPESLEELVPEYLHFVPDDYYAGGGKKLKYRVKDNGEYVVYSVGRDGEDDLGEEMKNWHFEGDLTFTVPPEPYR